mgnify:CR=1 FL=1
MLVYLQLHVFSTHPLAFASFIHAINCKPWLHPIHLHIQRIRTLFATEDQEKNMLPYQWKKKKLVKLNREKLIKRGKQGKLLMVTDSVFSYFSCMHYSRISQKQIFRVMADWKKRTSLKNLNKNQLIS